MYRRKLCFNSKKIGILVIFILSIAFCEFSFAVACIPIPVLIFELFEKKLEKREHLYINVLLGTFIVFSITGLISFPFFPQALALYSINEDIAYWFRIGHLHAVRLLIAYPGAIISKLFSIELTYGSTIYSCSILGIIAIYMLRILKKYNIATSFNEIVSLVFLVCVSLFMNGRLIFAFAGILLIIDAELKFKESEIGLCKLKVFEIIGLVFTMVSSGTMTVTTVYILIMSYLQWKNARKRKEREIWILIVLLVIYPSATIFVPYFMRFIYKNVDYYGGGIKGVIKMLQHGFGKVLYTTNTYALLCLFFAVICMCIINTITFSKFIVKRNNKYLPLLLIINICIYGGVFGISTALLCLFPLFLFIIAKFSKYYKIVF